MKGIIVIGKRIMSLILLLSFFACSGLDSNVSDEKLDESNVAVIQDEKILFYSPTEDGILDSELETIIKDVKDDISKITNHVVEGNESKLHTSEDLALKFFKDTKVKAYGSYSRFFRWNFTRTLENLNSIINGNFTKLASSSYSKVYELQGKAWVKVKNLNNNPIGKLLDMKILERSPMGKVTKIMLKGSDGTYTIENNFNIKNLFSGGVVKFFSGITKEAIFTSSTSLPAGEFAFERVGNTFHFYGGGYGHGYGMSQEGAGDLTRNYGKTYKEVLAFYYPGTKIEKLKDDIIRVLITTSAKNSVHNKITLYTSKGMNIKYGDKSAKVMGGKSLDLTLSSGKITGKVAGKTLFSTTSRVYLSSVSNMFGAPSIDRNQKKSSYPIYDGKMEVRISSGGLNLINEVSLEKYLENVVPSEMGSNFGLEALKAQAVAARTYAYRDMKKSSTISKGYHLVDTTTSQAYAYVDKREDATKAVELTRNEYLSFKGEPIQAFYYAVSSGYGKYGEY